MLGDRATRGTEFRRREQTALNAVDVSALGVQADCRDIHGLLAGIGSSGHEKTSGQKCKYASHPRMLLEVGHYLQRADVVRQ
ncbi:hypothetical protein [Stenotrophomonas hibiscicola]|uniref:hypothetical protein n=1 Tax=Stenotrophomonas hibiscicola TaxID=86189 RepID=UPI00320D7CFF